MARPRGKTLIRWPGIVEAAAVIAASYITAVTLRQLHYRLTSDPVTIAAGYVNTEYAYGRLSSLTAAARRAGTFPALADTGRSVSRPGSFESPEDAREYLADVYRLDRTIGQPVQTWVVYEKATLSAQVTAWLDPYGIPSAALRGYSSESLEREAVENMQDDGRPVVGWYVGDCDPEGEDIERNFVAQAEARGVQFKRWERLAVTPAEGAALFDAGMGNPGKPLSSRAPGFERRHGRLFQVELEAIAPDDLQARILTAVTSPEFFDSDLYESVLAAESEQRAQLRP